MYVKNYAEEKNLTISDLIEKGFDFYRSTDKKHAINRLKYHEERVLHWRGIVLQNDQQCNTKYAICNTVKEQFLANGRGSKETKRQDLNWCKAKSEKITDDGIIITPEELYEYCIGGNDILPPSKDGGF